MNDGSLIGVVRAEAWEHPNVDNLEVLVVNCPKNYSLVGRVIPIPRNVLEELSDARKRS